MENFINKEKMKVFLVIGLIILFSISYVSSVCTLVLDKSKYSQGETATVIGNCDGNPEKNTDYIINWTNGTGAFLEADSGVTPSVAGTNFFETFIIPSDYVSVNGTVLNVTLVGTGLEGEDSAIVQTAQETDLIISDVIFTDGIYLEKVAGVSFTVKDENGKLISNAFCDGILEDGNNFPLSAGSGITTRNGHGAFSRLIGHDTFREGRQYLAVVQCSCGLNATGTACFDEDGVTVPVSSGTISAPFTTLTWLSVNTLVNKEVYEMKNEIYICANVTNLDFDSRIPLKIFHQVRCSALTDNDNDLDRILIVHDDDMPDRRGIDFNTTQMQCKEFTLPEEDMLQGKTSECYASTEVVAIDSSGHILSTYSTTSPVFNITSDELNLDSDWAKINNRILNSIINLSNFIDYNGTGTGNIDIRLHGKFEELDIRNSFEIFNLIKNITVRNTTSLLTEHVDWELEFLEDDNIEIEIRNVPLTKTGSEWWNITLEFYDFEKRQTEAFEDIANKTGTFHFSVDCPSEGVLGRDMTCQINAEIEKNQVVRKEAKFTCFIWDEINQRRYSELTFQQMITRDRVTIERDFLVPRELSSSEQYELRCEVEHWDVGKRTETSQIDRGLKDTFTAVVMANPIKIVGDVISKVLKTQPLLLLIFGCFFIFLIAKDVDKKYKKYKNGKKEKTSVS